MRSEFNALLLDETLWIGLLKLGEIPDGHPNCSTLIG
jgi:hypothetical protein